MYSANTGYFRGASALSLHTVLALVVPAQIHLALEALRANVTTKGLEASVFAAVSDQVGALTECFSTHLAFMRLLSCVNVCVFLHI